MLGPDELMLPQLLTASVILEVVSSFNSFDDYPSSDKPILRRLSLVTPIFISWLHDGSWMVFKRY